MSNSPSQRATLERWLSGPRVGGVPVPEHNAPAPLLSFEFFPPKTEALEQQLWACIRRLEPLAPHFVSVTYGAGGTTQARTHATVARIVAETTLTPAAHLTCVGASRGEIDDIARQYWDAGVRHIVALRGDVPGGGAYEPHPDGYAYAADLVAGLKRVGDFEISVAAYPEGHPEAASPAADLDNLKRKIDAGATRAISQFFFDNDKFLAFQDRAAKAGITVPIIPGILPITNFTRTVEMAGKCGASIPAAFADAFEGVDQDPEVRLLVAAHMAVEQCRDLLDRGVRHFHFYTLNRADLTLAICHLLGVRAARKPE